MHAIRTLTTGKPFQRIIVGVIIFAGIVAGLETDSRLVTEYGDLFATLDLLIVSIFILEALLKMAAHGKKPWLYFADGWNVFDFTIIVLCLLPVGGPFAAVLRLARALRLMRLVSTLPNLQLLVGALLKSLAAMGYVTLLLGLLFYIYAVAGIHLFGETDPEHFGSLSSALFSLFKIVTLDNWADIYNAQIGHVPVFKVAGYFITFIVIGTMIILNLFIGIIMNSMAEMHEEIAEKEARGKEAGVTRTKIEELVTLERQLVELRKSVRRVRLSLDQDSSFPNRAPESTS
jgi:voltage-gated sodium channel